jgi:hypothetical protein
VYYGQAQAFVNALQYPVIGRRDAGGRAFSYRPDRDVKLN